MEQLIRGLFAFYHVSASKLDLKIDTDDIVLEVTQAIPLGLIVNELLTNVLKHAFPDGRVGTVWASLRYLREESGSQETLDEGSAVLTVEDNGVGLPEGFDIQRQDSMGVYLVRVLTRQLRGSVHVKQDGENAVSRGLSASTPRVGPMSGLKILLVEDEILIAEDARIRLEGMGHQVIGIAASGRDAVQQAIESQPDLILMDVRLQGAMNGVEAARRIRSEADIPIIYITAHARFLAPWTSVTDARVCPSRFLPRSYRGPSGDSDWYGITADGQLPNQIALRPEMDAAEIGSPPLKSSFYRWTENFAESPGRYG